MNPTEEDNIEKEADAFISMLEENLPSAMSSEHIVAVIGTIITEYIDDPREAHVIMIEADKLIQEFYADHASSVH